MARKFSTFFDDLATGYDQFVQVITDVIVAELASQSGLARAVVRGPITFDALAAETGLPRDKVVRVVDYLRAHDLMGLSADGQVTQTKHTARLAEPKNDGMWYACLTFLIAGSQLTAGLRQGKPPFQLRYGKPVFEYFGENATARERFGHFMSFMTDLVVKFVHDNFKFAPFQVVADIGGSHGDLLFSVLERYPGTRGILFDLPGVIEHAEPAVRASAHAGRIEMVGGSFFEGVPAADLYLLKQILHDWSDAECLTILGSIRKAIKPNGRVVVVDYMLADDPKPTQGLCTDIAMMVWDTGRERRKSDFETLFAQAGFRLERIVENPMGHSVVEAILA